MWIGEEGITLELAYDIGGFGSELLVRPDDQVDLQLRLQDSEACVAVIGDDGQEYEVLLTTPGWVFAQPPRLLGPNGEEILPGDAIDVIGEVGPGTGHSGPGWLLLTYQIEAGAAP